ncbi:MAG: hypothetical protein NTW86_26910 [Candidatus Sumerlaeota bacterium]|nr:hypothetical protein [Candidatus Sumerlaeota bacterium]
MAPMVTVEKRLPIFSTGTLLELARIGVKIHGGSGRLFATLEVPDGAEKEVLRLLKGEGYILAVEEDRSAESEA